VSRIRGVRSNRARAAVVWRLTGDSAQVQPLFLNFDPWRFTVPMSRGTAMQTQSASYARHWEPEVDLMPATPVKCDLRLRARELISEGRLPCFTHYRTWGGRGSNEPCALCEALIKGDEVEYEIEPLEPESERRYHFHFTCHDAWQQACTQPRSSWNRS
jgi:hypothetical protein